jgi:SAM-dependent methyltransferase
MFPQEFDLNCYIESNSDIDFEKIHDLLLHLQSIGRNEGRSANKIKNRFDFINLIDSRLKILEIGPFVNPLIRGANIKYADVLNRSELIARAEKGGRAFDDAPEIDYVLENLNIGIIEEKFDYVISSHCIEHQPDLIGHLQDVDSILKDDGYYFLIIPDKRFCFDRYLPLTLLPDIIDAHYNKKKFHDLRAIIF